MVSKFKIVFSTVLHNRKGEIGTIAILIGMAVIGLGVLVGSQIRNQNINISPQAAIEDFPVEAWWTNEGTSHTVDDRIDFIFATDTTIPCTDATRAVIRAYDSRNNNKDLGLMTSLSEPVPSGYGTVWQGKWPDQNAQEKCYIRFYGTKEQLRMKGLSQYIRLQFPGQTAMSNEINLGNPPAIPNCSNLSGPTSLTVGQSGTYSATVTSQQGQLTGEIFVGNFASTIKRQTFAGTSATISGTWSPTRAGTYTIGCRAWNDGIAECRPPSLVDKVPRHNCAGPGYQMTVTVTAPTATPIPPVTCVPEVNAPANNSSISTIPATISWRSCGTGYYYQLSFTQGFAWTSFALSGTSHTMNGFTFNRGTTYKWRIRACRDSNCTNVGPWSSTYTFTYPALPTNTPSPTVTRKPTATPTTKPTNTPVPPTNTPRPPTSSPTVKPPTATVQPATPTATVPPATATVIVDQCPKRTQGDANCDGKVDYVDFVCWRGELNNNKPANCNSADFNSSGGKPDSADYTIWRKTFLEPALTQTQ